MAFGEEMAVLSPVCECECGCGEKREEGYGWVENPDASGSDCVKRGHRGQRQRSDVRELSQVFWGGGRGGEHGGMATAGYGRGRTHKWTGERVEESSCTVRL